jgi:lysophospholipase L1-like esterase
MRIKTLLLAALLAGTAAAHAAAHADVAVDPRWQSSLAEFAEADKLRAPLPGGVLFVGSSSIRLWDGLERQFDVGTAGIVKRGFGGSRMLDCRQLVDQLVLPYQPRQVVVYAGDNDLAEGRAPKDVAGDFAGFVERVRTALPDTRIAYVSIKPSPLRAALLPRIREANALIAAYAAATPNLDYIDIHSKMLDADGRPRADLYGDDRLHMNAAGYQVWQQAIAPHLAVKRVAVRAAP